MNLTIVATSILLAFISFAQERKIDSLLLKNIQSPIIYPTPADRALFIEWNNIDNYIVKLYNSYGKRVITAIPYSTLHKIELQTTHLQDGIYIAKIFSSNKVVASKRIIIKHY
ncbi:T9SS type A sorting domain-containing protein [Pseudofulvibacter geojedonensis]|uniref:T9SS type A sorting domain-containing protein n=1 Tax=Pseudofulvibacter geojedonensis TaxID=1123758 RepID=A0ABW3HY29_9FLAO